MFGFRLISRGRGAGGRSGSGQNWLGLFWGLALVPLLGWGQVILEPPRNMTVCVGESAIFRSILDGDLVGWKVNGTLSANLSPDIYRLFVFSPAPDDKGNIILSMTALPSDTIVLNNTRVESVAYKNLTEIISESAYLTYQAKLQYPVTNLRGTTNQKAVQLYWQSRRSNLTTRFLIGVQDLNAPDDAASLETIYTTDTNHYDYDPETACYHLQFRVIAQECPGNETDSSNLAIASPVILKKPDIQAVTLEYADRVVRVGWEQDGSGAYRIEITDLGNHTQPGFDTCYNCPPYFYSPEACGRHYHLNFAVTPAECHGSGFTYNASIYFYMDCLALAEAELPVDPVTYTTPTKSAAAGLGLYPLLPVVAIISLAARF